MIVRRPKAKQRFRKVILNVARFIEEIFLAITGLNLDRKRSLGQTLFSVLSRRRHKAIAGLPDALDSRFVVAELQRFSFQRLSFSPFSLFVRGEEWSEGDE